MSQIAIITATLNSQNFILELIRSLNSQTNKNFCWYIIDCLSTDNTVELIKNYSEVNYQIISEQDSGIYDALNKAIKIIEEEYYLVLGSDDIIYQDTINSYIASIKKNPDLVFSRWNVNQKTLKPKTKFGWLNGMLGVGSSHSVATLIKKKLHLEIGYYDLNYRMCADQLFIKKVCYKKNTKILYEKFISGKFNSSGYSSTNIFQYINELFLIQISTEKYKFLQLILYLLRVIKHWKKIKNR